MKSKNQINGDNDINIHLKLIYKIKFNNIKFYL